MIVLASLSIYRFIITNDFVFLDMTSSTYISSVLGKVPQELVTSLHWTFGCAPVSYLSFFRYSNTSLFCGKYLFLINLFICLRIKAFITNISELLQ